VVCLAGAGVERTCNGLGIWLGLLLLLLHGLC
jgi:hypothetical protein